MEAPGASSMKPPMITAVANSCRQILEDCRELVLSLQAKNASVTLSMNRYSEDSDNTPS